jgi:nucleotide-binding universal stress UspA family protein
MTPESDLPMARAHRPFDTVLIGTSLGDESDRVVRSGLAVARAGGAKVYLVHAVPVEPLSLASELGPEFLRRQVAGAEEQLRQQVARLGIGEAELAGARVLSGAPHFVLIDAARTAGADLIVLGATGSGPFAAELLGSTADRVLRKAFCPVLVVRGELPVPPRRVLAPVDLSPLSGDAFRCGLHLLRQLVKEEDGIELRVVFAQSFLDTLPLLQQQGADLSSAALERHGSEELQGFVRENGPEAPFHVETAVLPGEPRFEILHELAEHPVDLVMLGTHGRGGLDRLVLGSVASTVARKAPCSVLMISAEAALGEGIAEAVLARTTPAWGHEPVPTR